jgi:hypothetical protein
MADARRPGRPPLDARGRLSVPVAVRVTLAQYDALYARAQRDRVSLPEAIRRALEAEKRSQK